MKKHSQPILSDAPPNVAALPPRRPTRAEAETAVRTLIAWAGDDPNRPGLLKTPERVIEAYREYFGGYRADAIGELTASCDEPAGYDDFVLVRDIAFESHCEHHMSPFFGVAHVAYIPHKRIAGLSRIARVVEIFARRLQIQEMLTGEIADTLAEGLKAKGVAVTLQARHHCLSARGVNKALATTVTSRFLGAFQDDAALRARFTAMIAGPSHSH